MQPVAASIDEFLEVQHFSIPEFNQSIINYRRNLFAIGAETDIPVSIAVSFDLSNLFTSRYVPKPDCTIRACRSKNFTASLGYCLIEARFVMETNKVGRLRFSQSGNLVFGVG
jgi:hypothetical protein